jgi:hypothetical protein
MHSFEETIVELLERGEEPTVAHFGDAPALLNAVSAIGKSRLAPEFLRLALNALPTASDQEKTLLSEFVCQCVETATDDFLLMEVVDLLDGGRPLPENGDDRCFARFLAVASDGSASPMSRAAALDGAFRWAMHDRRRQFRLLDFLIGIPASEHAIFLARAAKIMGVAYSHWQESELVKRLREFVDIEGVKDEAAFELGMAMLTDGLEKEDRQTAAELFESARYWFTVAAEHREQRPDATAYIHCLNVLTAFSRGEKQDQISDLASVISEVAFQIDAWHTSSSDPPWLGARHVESGCWNLLALRLQGLSAHLEEVSWWEPAVVVEQHIIASYAASRSILRRSRYGGVEALVRPRIEGSLARHEGQALALKTWLRLHPSHEWEKEARELSRQVDALVTQGNTKRPNEAAIEGQTIAALLEKAKIPDDVKALANEIIADALTIHLNNLSAAEMSLIQDCVSAISDHYDYKNNPRGKRLFHTVLIWTIRFLHYRLEMTQGNDPGAAYLFEDQEQPLPHEKKLQDDYHRFVYSNVAGTEIEIENIGSGRADVRFSYSGERLVVEVKREIGDCSFDALKQSYASQATDYQNVSIRLGFVLVLDLTEIRKDGTPHITDLVQPSEVLRKSDTYPRWIVFVKVPGRRFRPSDL